MTDYPAGGLGAMLRLVDDLPDQIAASAELSGYDRLRSRPGLTRIVLCGMGGSAIAGDLVQPVLAGGATSLTVWRDYGLPHWVGPADLVICASYSGNTEETLSAAVLAGERGCARIGITAGGRLAELGASDDFPCVTLPGGLPPRAALGYGLGALVRSLERLGACPDGAGRLEKAQAQLRLLGPVRREPLTGGAVPADDGAGNIAPDALAAALLGRLPVIYTAGHEAHGAGLRLRAQLNENAKSPALLAAFPELDHNDLVGWTWGPQRRDEFVLLILRGKDDNARTARRVAVTSELLQEQFAAIHEIHAVGDAPLARVMSLVQYGDYLSCHMAGRGGIDPVPVDRISKLKTALG